MTYYEKLKLSTKEDMIKEFAKVIEWTLNCTITELGCVYGGENGLEGFLEEIFDCEVT